MIHRVLITNLMLIILFVAREAVADVDFVKEIEPILKKHCLDCHGPDTQESKLRLDRRVSLLKGGDSGLPAIKPGQPNQSHLLERVKSTKPKEFMPPDGGRLSENEIKLLEKWIAEGANWPGQMDAKVTVTTDHWSFQPVKRPEVPSLARHPVDAFLLATLKSKGLAFNPPAAPRDLIRRVSIVLTGLPPTPERVKSFEAASAANAQAAYAELVDELLNSPQFGERWAQHWLDVIRWAESNGSEANLYRKNAWIYRDYVIRAFNEDKPYDRFIQEQLAGDQLGAGEATGFLVAGPHVPAATVGQEPTAIRQARADRMDEIMQTVGASVLGMTVGCARCHNHKFDPISIQDYYSLTAVFQGAEFGGRFPELSDDHPRKRRANELYPKMSAERSVLRKDSGVWEEDWGGFRELQFPATKTSALRVDFDKPFVIVDELQVFGPADQRKNFALASAGTKLVTDEAMIQLRGELSNANDGEFGTQSWKSRAPAGSKDKPWVEIHFAEPREVSRFRFSNNREYYFETDYLAEARNYQFPGYRISAQQPDGTWRKVGSTQTAKQNLASNAELKRASERLHQLIATLAEEGPRHSFIARFQEPPVTRVLHRGSPENPRDEVFPAGFAVLRGDLGLDSSAPDARRRLQFAEWVTHPDHPLTSRVMVNRVWQHLFGSGLVTTANDFGKAGALPTHPELLDWLAAEFVCPTQNDEKPWSVKSLVRRIVMSQAFQQSSRPQAEGLKADAGAALMWRFPPQRLAAEVIRDGILQASGKLDRTVGGRSYRIHNEKRVYEQWAVVDNHGPDTWRRMIYQERMRRVDDQMFMAFDFPDCGQVLAKRPVSTTPLQALNLMNSPFVVEQAQFIAARSRAESGDDEAAVRRAFELLLTRDPTAEELAACRETSLELVCRALMNSNEWAFLP